MHIFALFEGILGQADLRGSIKNPPSRGAGERSNVLTFSFIFKFDAVATLRQFMRLYFIIAYVFRKTVWISFAIQHIATFA